MDFRAKFYELPEQPSYKYVKKYGSVYCYVPTQLFLALYMCVFIFGFPCGYF